MTLFTQLFFYIKTNIELISTFVYSLGCGIGYGYLHRIPVRSIPSEQKPLTTSYTVNIVSLIVFYFSYRTQLFLRFLNEKVYLHSRISQRLLRTPKRQQQQQRQPRPLPWGKSISRKLVTHNTECLSYRIIPFLLRIISRALQNATKKLHQLQMYPDQVCKRRLRRKSVSPAATYLLFRFLICFRINLLSIFLNLSSVSQVCIYILFNNVM